MDFNEVKQIIIAGYEDSRILIWDIEKFTVIDKLNYHSSSVCCIGFQPNSKGEIFISLDIEGNCILWNNLIKIKSIFNNLNIKTFIFSKKNGNYLYLSDNKKILIFNWKNKVLEKELFNMSETKITVGFDDEIISFSNNKNLVLYYMEIQEKKYFPAINRQLNGIKSIVYSPDGKFICSTSCDKGILIWNVRSGKIIQELYDHSEEVNCLAISHLDFLASGGKDNNIIIWEFFNERVNFKFRLKQHKNEIIALDFSHDGHILASLCKRECIVWNLQKNFEDSTTMENTIIASVMISDANFLIFSPKQCNLIGICDKNKIFIWNREKSQEQSIIPIKNVNLQTLVFTLEGKRIISGGKNSFLALWDLISEKKIIEYEGHNGDIVKVLISKNGRLLISGCTKSTIIIWNLITGIKLITLTHNLKVILSLALSPNGKMLASIDSSKQISFWAMFRSNDDIYLPLKNYLYFSFSKIDQTIAFIDNKKLNLNFYSIQNKEISNIKLRIKASFIKFCKKGNILALISKNEFYIYNYKKQKLENEICHKEEITSICFASSKNDNYIVIGDCAGKISFYNLENLPEEERSAPNFYLITAGEHNKKITNLFYSNLTGINYLISICWDSKIIIWNIDEQSKIKNIQTDEIFIKKSDLSNKGILAVPSHNRKINIYNLNLKEKVEELQGHHCHVECVAFHPKGMILASGDERGLIIIWETINFIKIKKINKHILPVKNLEYSPDGIILASLNNKGNLNLYYDNSYYYHTHFFYNGLSSKKKIILLLNS